MRIAFYAPLKAPDHATPSGDRRMANLLLAALAVAGHAPETVSRLRSFEGEGDAARQAEIRAAGARESAALIARYRAMPTDRRPGAWFTYHLYHKAPDWLGPAVSDALGIPYVVAEASFAPKRADGPWAEGHAAAGAAIARADAVLSLSSDDAECLRALLRARPDRLVPLRPFLDATLCRADRQAARARLAAVHGLDPEAPWLLTVAMMRPGDKLASYRRLGAALARLGARDWRLLVVGDGPARGAVEAALGVAPGGRIAYAGEQTGASLPAYYAAADIHVWPAVNEAYGMALLEAQAAGLPVVAGRVRGVADVVRDGETGLLVDDGDDEGFARALCGLLDDGRLRARLGAAAAENVAARHGLEAAAATIVRALAIAGVVP